MGMSKLILVRNGGSFEEIVRRSATVASIGRLGKDETAIPVKAFTRTVMRALQEEDLRKQAVGIFRNEADMAKAGTEARLLKEMMEIAIPGFVKSVAPQNEIVAAAMLRAFAEVVSASEIIIIASSIAVPETERIIRITKIITNGVRQIESEENFKGEIFKRKVAAASAHFRPEDIVADAAKRLDDILLAARDNVRENLGRIILDKVRIAVETEMYYSGSAIHAAFLHSQTLDAFGRKALDIAECITDQMCPVFPRFEHIDIRAHEQFTVRILRADKTGKEYFGEILAMIGKWISSRTPENAATRDTTVDRIYTKLCQFDNTAANAKEQYKERIFYAKAAFLIYKLRAHLSSEHKAQEDREFGDYLADELSKAGRFDDKRFELAIADVLEAIYGYRLVSSSVPENIPRNIEDAKASVRNMGEKAEIRRHTLLRAYSSLKQISALNRITDQMRKCNAQGEFAGRTAILSAKAHIYIDDVSELAIMSGDNFQAAVRHADLTSVGRIEDASSLLGRGVK